MVFPVTKLITHRIGVSLISLGPGTLARCPVKVVVNELYILRKHSARTRQPNIVQYVAMPSKNKSRRRIIRMENLSRTKINTCDAAYLKSICLLPVRNRLPLAVCQMI
jgi:hypothetical protein